MKILVVGGTRFIGVHLVKNLLAEGHEVTIATRGRTEDMFGGSVDRLILERTDAESISRVLGGKSYDVVYDSQAFSSNEIKYLLDAVMCGKYIETSTVSVYYPNFKPAMVETDFDPYSYPMKWCTRNDFGYDEIKRQAECAMFQAYGHIPCIAVRFPLVIGEDDYTKRLYFYVEHIIKSKPMFIDNLNAEMAFILSDEAGRFLAWLADKDFCGSINAANNGSMSLAEIIKYVKNKADTNAIICESGEQSPLNGFVTYGLNLEKAERIGYTFPDLAVQMYTLLDKYINTASNEKNV
jgi:nucleoside-diphosphate-sugar epimerase